MQPDTSLKRIIDNAQAYSVKPFRDFVWLLRAELFLLREQWFWYLIQSSFVPISYLVFLWFILDRHDPMTLTFLVVGSLVTSLSFGGMLSLGQHIGFLKDYNAFDYYASLPVAKAVFIAAITTRGMLLSLPSAILIITLANLFLGLQFSLLALGILLLAAYAMSGFGALIGFWSPTGQVASLTTQILQTIIIFFAPVYFPASVLPEWLRYLSLVWPTTHAASALQSITTGGPTETVWMSTLILLGFCVFSLVLVPLRLDWRARQ